MIHKEGSDPHSCCVIHDSFLDLVGIYSGTFRAEIFSQIAANMYIGFIELEDRVCRLLDSRRTIQLKRLSISKLPCVMEKIRQPVNVVRMKMRDEYRAYILPGIPDCSETHADAAAGIDNKYLFAHHNGTGRARAFGAWVGIAGP
jgi:hypothetical protein